MLRLQKENQYKTASYIIYITKNGSHKQTVHGKASRRGEAEEVLYSNIEVDCRAQRPLHRQ